MINLLYIDLFCGAGGTSKGVNEARLNGEPSYDEDNGLITCGNAILSGKLPTSEYEIIENND